jgi:hypothetical protein
VLAAVAYGGVLAWSCALSARALPLTVTLGAAGALLLLLVLGRGLDELLGSAVLLLGPAYVLGLLAGRHSLDQAAPLVAAGLLACTELATWSLEERPPVPAPRAVVLARARAVGVLLLAGVAASAAVVAVAATPFGSGLGWTILGAAAAVSSVAVVVRLSRY